MGPAHVRLTLHLLAISSIATVLQDVQHTVLEARRDDAEVQRHGEARGDGRLQAAAAQRLATLLQTQEVRHDRSTLFAAEVP